MKILSKAGLLLATLTLTLAANAEAKRYIVQFKSPTTFKAVAQQHASKSRFNGPAQTLFNTRAQVTHSLNNVQLMIVEANSAADIEALRNNPNVALVEEEMFHPAPPKLARWGQTSGLTAKGRMALDQPWGIGAVKAPAAWSVTKGAGARVLVLDTGVDKAHPALATRFEKGRNFTGGGPENYQDDMGHGTHVAGTILADAINADALSGVAPEAKLLMGKVCTANGCGTAGIVQGIDWAISEKVDVVNMSLGGPFLGSGEQAAVLRAEQAGVLIVAASGNDGAARVSYPAAFDTVLAVGAIDSTNKKADFSNWGPALDVMAPGVDVLSSVPQGSARASEVSLNLDGKGLTDVKSQAMAGSPIRPISTLNLVYAGLGKPADFTGIDVRGKFALIARGEIPFKDKVSAAISNGAVGVIIYNNAPGLILGGLTEDGSEVAVPVTMIEQVAGEAAKAALAAGPVQGAFGVVPSDYDRYAGTSMASPHAAGVAALIRSVNKTLTPAQVRDLMKNTATPLGPNEANQYGRGLINAEAAVSQAIAVPAPLRAAN